ncbi:putative transport permease YfiM [Paraliobacillus quinghaiensis]|uniref:Transport permease YfiM n=1 Tax=Paraliobacillus quinghaiensis TaxID=470815 RepID=A0A917THX7_9BACI|nr:ABC transporter permease [Paraliobacillus quinghaiensis]GGM23858.1 putative transport permease YfiM [Paraliobacillus quinghaiensis]
MKFFTIAFKDLKVRLSDKKGFISLLLMPIILTAILGSALSGMFADTVSMPHTELGIVLHDQNEITDQFVEEVLQGDILSESITLKKFSSQSDLKIDIENQTVDLGLVIPKGWGEGLQNGEEKDVMVFTDPSKQLQSSIVESITMSFIDRIASISTATQVFSQELAMIAPVTDQEINVREIVGDVSNQLVAVADSEMNVVTAEEDGKTPISGMQYYAAAMGAMFVLFNATIGAKSIIQERNIETLARLMSSPVRLNSIIIGKFLGTFYVSFLQFSVFILATHYLLGVGWGSNLFQTLVIGLSYCIAVSGIAMIIAGLIVEEKTADTVGGIGVQIFALLGGSMIPIGAFPEKLQLVANIAPNKWFLDSLLEVMNGTTWGALVLPITVLLLIGVASLMIGSLRLRVR